MQKVIPKETAHRGLLLLSGVCALFCLLTLSSCGGSGEGGGSGLSGPPRSTEPVVLEITQPGTQVAATEKATIDYSNAAEGYVCVMSNVGDSKVKVLVEVAGKQYQYAVATSGAYVTIPLSEGNGAYVIGVFEHVVDNRYSPIVSHTIEVALNDEFLPFLHPSQFVNYAAGDDATVLSQELAEGAVADVDVLNTAYEWVCENISYDTEKAVEISSGLSAGYLPNNTDTISSKEGICFDYAVLTVSLLRAQRIPAKLVIGYAGSAYHAWIAVYCVESGNVVGYELQGEVWSALDPTFDAAMRGSVDLSGAIGNGTDYNAMFYY